jgi:hypothetical protein
MSDGPLSQRDVALLQVETLIHRGEQLQQSAIDAAGAARDDGLRAWQQQCAAAIHHLSGGSKAHWLSRAFSQALLVRSIDGAAVVEAPAEEIVRRIVDVLAQARASLQQMDVDADAGDEPAPANVARFAFVHRRELQPILDRTFADSRDAFDGGDFASALVLGCTVLDAIVTDALEHAGRLVGEMSFDARIAAAERAALIRGGCARLPRIALDYRDLLDASGTIRCDAIVLARDARVVGQVLRVVMRDLDPGR